MKRGATPVRSIAVLGLLSAMATGVPAQERPRLTGTLTGMVRDTNAQPLSLVRVRLLADTSRATWTDSLGAYRLDGVTSGLHRVQYRRLGFLAAEFTFVVLDGQESRAIIELVPTTVRLDTITVASPALTDPALERTGFYDRLRAREEGAGVGRFITPDDMERLRSFSKTTHIVETAGVRLIHQERGMSLWPVGTSNVILRARPLLIGPCQMAVFIDGIEVDIGKYYQPPGPGEAGSTGGIDAYIRPQEIRAIEVYQSASGTPQQFQSVRNAQCGSIVIWTK